MKHMMENFDGADVLIFRIDKSWKIYNDARINCASSWPYGYVWNEITAWCMKHCPDHWWTDGSRSIGFSRKADAMLFKLVFV